jgi:ABC-2 type transport system permease protein
MTSLVPTVKVDGAEVSYLSFVLPGILAMAAWQRGIHSSSPIFVDRMTGELENLFSLPIERWHVLYSNVLVAVLQSLVYGVALLGVAWAMGARFHIGIASIGAMAAVVAVFTWFVGMVFCAINSLIAQQETFNLVSNILILPLVFTSSAFYPVDAAPLAIRAISAVNPINLAAVALRAVLLGSGAMSPPVSLRIAVLAGCAVVASIAAGSVFYRAAR